MSEATLNRVITAAVEKAQKDGMDLPHFCVHDLRRTASTLLHEAGFNTGWIEKCQAHQQKGVRAVYNKAEYAEQRRAMLQSWAEMVDDWIRGSKATPVGLRSVGSNGVGKSHADSMVATLAGMQGELEQHGLGHLNADACASRLCSGEAMRVSLIGAWLSDVNFLILDEPCNPLDRSQGRMPGSRRGCLMMASLNRAAPPQPHLRASGRVVLSRWRGLLAAGSATWTCRRITRLPYVSNPSLRHPLSGQGEPHCVFEWDSAQRRSENDRAHKPSICHGGMMAI